MNGRPARFPAAALLAAVITGILFILMQKLVSPESGYRGDLEPVTGIRFGPVDIPNEIETRKRRKPEQPPPPSRPPPPPRLQVPKTQPRSLALERMDMPHLDVPLVSGSGLYLGQPGPVDRAEEGDVIPMVMIRPMYPREAALAGIEGWVRIEFTITENGEVRNPRVVDAEPARVFNREAIRAILKWKFKPRIINGVAVERQATQTIDFTLEGR